MSNVNACKAFALLLYVSGRLVVTVAELLYHLSLSKTCLVLNLSSGHCQKAAVSVHSYLQFCVILLPPDIVGEGIMFSGCPSAVSFVRTDIFTTISHDRLEQCG